MAFQITQGITPLPQHPDRTNEEAFPGQMSAFFAGEALHAQEMIDWTIQANALADAVEADAVEAEAARIVAGNNADRAEAAQTAAENAAGASTWSYATSYGLNDAVTGADGQSYRSLTNSNAGNCPHAYNQITRVGALNHYKAETVAVADPSGKTYTLKVKMWRETLTGNISLVIEEGSGDFEIMVYDSKVVTRTIAEYSATATFPAGSDADVRIRINPDDNDGPDGDTFGVHSVFLFDHADPDTNLLTGDSRWQTDLTGWAPTNCTISTVAANKVNWVKISGGNEIPVGGVYIDADTNADPALKLGYGTWELISQGRALFGIDETDNDPIDYLNALGLTGGEKRTQLSISHLPGIWYPGDLTTIYAQVGTDPYGVIKTRHIYGGEQSHNNMPPYLVVGIWKRTA